MTVSLRGRSTGGFTSGHDALYAYPADMQHNGALVADVSGAAGLPRVDLAAGVDQRVKWVWAIPTQWRAMAVRFGTVAEGTTSANTVWEFATRPIHLGNSDVDGAMTTESPVTLGAGAQHTWQYRTPTEWAAIEINEGLFGDYPFVLCSLARLGTDGADVYADAIGVATVTATRVDR